MIAAWSAHVGPGRLAVDLCPMPSLHCDYMARHAQFPSTGNARAHRQNELIASTSFLKTRPKPAQVFSSKKLAKS